MIRILDLFAALICVCTGTKSDFKRPRSLMNDRPAIMVVHPVSASALHAAVNEILRLGLNFATGGALLAALFKY